MTRSRVATHSPRKTSRLGWAVLLIAVVLSLSPAWADNSWETFPTDQQIQQAWETKKAKDDAIWPGRVTTENFRVIKYHHPNLKDPLLASGVLLYSDGVITPDENGPTLENTYFLEGLKFEKGKGWVMGGWGKEFPSSAAREDWLSSFFAHNPPDLGSLHNYGRDRGSKENVRPNRERPAFVKGWPDSTAGKPAKIDSRLVVTITSTAFDPEWTDSSGQKVQNILVRGSVDSPSPLTSSTFYRSQPNQKQGFLTVSGTSFTAKAEVLIGQNNTFVLAFYNQADRNVEKTFTFSALGQVEQTADSDLSDDPDPFDEPLPGLGSIGNLPGPESMFQGLVGVVAPGLMAIVMGILGSAGGPGSPPPPSPKQEQSPDPPDPSEQDYSDGRDYKEGGYYTFHNGVQYKVNKGQFEPVREMAQGESFVDPDGQERVWQGNQAWTPSDWQQQQETNTAYQAAHQADWNQASQKLDPHVQKGMERIAQDSQMLANLELMRRQVICGPAQVSMLNRENTPGSGFQEKVDRAIEGYFTAGKIDREAYNQIRRVYGLARTGQIAGERDLHSQSQIFRNAVCGAVQSTEKEIFAGVNSKGETSYKSIALRALTAAATGGASEMAYTPASSLYTMKDYVDKGGDSVAGGFLQTTRDVIKGEIYGRIFGKGMEKAGQKLGQVAQKASQIASKHFPKATLPVSEKLSRLGDELSRQRRSPFDAKIQPKPKVPARVRPRPSKAEVIERLEQIRARSADPLPGLKVDKNSFTPAKGAADLKGVPKRDLRAIQMVSDRHGVRAHFRPTDKFAKAEIESGRALPKPEMLKSKTVSDDDILLGFSHETRGTVCCKQPTLPEIKPPHLTPEKWGEVQKRFGERSAEYLDQSTKLNDLVEKKIITWNKRTGEIRHAKTGQAYVGDNDAYCYVDAVTGKPVSAAVNRQINRELQSAGATNHNEQLGWDYSDLDRNAPEGAPPGAQSEYEVAKGIDEKILAKHTEGVEDAKALNTYDPLTGGEEGWTSSWWTGGQRKFPGGESH